MRNLFRRLVAGFVLVLALLIAAPATFTFAADGATTPTLSAVKLSALLVTFIVGTLLPIVVGIVTRTAWPSTVKSVVLLVANAANALIVDHRMGDGSAFITQQAAVLWFMSLVVSVAMFFGVYVPAKITNRPGGKLERVGFK